MRKLLLLICLFLFIVPQIFAQNKISSLEFVQILDGNKAEALYYYQNNWKVLREMAIEKDYIHSYQLLEVEATEDAPFHIILITNYSNEEEYEKREEHFTELIEAKGELRLMNEKKPGEFRRRYFGKDKAINLH